MKQRQIDEVAIDIVCIERVPMKLRGPDCVEVVRRLSAKGLQNGEIAQLVRVTTSHVSRIQREYGIAPAPPPWHWHSYLMTPRERVRATERRREWARARKAGA